MSRYGGPPPERWDRSRFDAHTRGGGGGGPQLVERDRFEERDYYEPQRQRDRSADYYRDQQPRFREEDRYFEERDRFSQPMPFRSSRPNPRYYEEERDPYEGAMVPVRRDRPRDREIEIDIHERERYQAPPRPKFVRRQSSLDTFDRKPMPRYGDQVREETIMIPTGPRRRSPPRYHSPPRFQDREYDEIRIAETDAYGDEEFRGYREREIERFRTNRRRSQETVVEEDRTIIEETTKEYPRRGKTRMPMRLINKRAVIELGYPYEEEGETLIILKALGKEHIDEVIRISKEMNALPPLDPPAGEKEVRTTTYVYEHDQPQHPPGQMVSLPPPPHIVPIPPPPPGFEEKIVERRTEIIREGSPSRSEVPRSVRDWDVLSKKSGRRSPSPASSHHSRHTSHTHRSRRRSRAHSHAHSRPRSLSSGSTKREIIITDDREESATIVGGVGALIVPAERERRDSKAIKAEIRALEAERRALKYERDSEKYTGGEIIIAREARPRSRSRSRSRSDTIEVKKDKKAPDPRIIRAMLATLT